jgi:hypothetical protein
MTDDVYKEDVYESSEDLFITREDLDSLIGGLNEELEKLVVRCGEEHITGLVQLIVTTLSNLEDLYVLAKGSVEARSHLQADLRLLEEKYEREKIYRSSCESKLLQIEFENEEERCTFKSTIDEQLKLIRKLERKCKDKDLDSISSGFVEFEEDDSSDMKYDFSPVINLNAKIELNTLLKQNQQLVFECESGQSILKQSFNEREEDSEKNIDSIVS